ncbi:MAG: alpha/beta hydrolase family protein [Acidobacteriota bacterium]
MLDLVDGVFYSSLIQKNLPYRVLVPDATSRTDAPLPVLYLLHGLFGSYQNWADLTTIKSYVENKNLMIVMPEGGDNWYTDSEENWESYLIEDLMPEVERRFYAGGERRERAIAGNSMGGYGALKLALKYPDTFGFAASFSGAFRATRFLGGTDERELTPSVSRVFGDENSQIRIENDLFTIAAGASGNANGLPGIYFDCGLDDPFIAANREFAATLTTAGIEHEYLEVAGGHDWPYWDERVRYLISILKDEFVS